MTMTERRTETLAEAWSRRGALRGDVDFTMMYVAHDAFCRDLDRLLAAASSGDLLAPEARASWKLFARMLETHHTAEDASLWPPLKEALTDPADLAILAQMRAEHAALDPLLEAIDTAYTHDRAADAARDLARLSSGLRGHMLHEENDALPLLERTLGAEGWAAFGREMSRRIGMREMPTVLPWLLEDAAPARAAAILSTVPAPVRLLLRDLWAKRYRQAPLLHGEAAS
jgi:hypothetical protein